MANVAQLRRPERGQSAVVLAAAIEKAVGTEECPLRGSNKRME